MNVTIISTFSEKNYVDYGQYFVRSLHNFLDTEIRVILYTDSLHSINKENWQNVILHDACTNLVDFKKRNSHKTVPQGKKGFLKDAVKFSHKSYCITHAAKNCTTDRLIWLDADTEILSYISKDYLTQFLNKNKFVSYLGRENKYTETGWLQFNMTNSYAQDFFNRWEWYYNSDEIYNLPEQLDCHVFDAVRTEFENTGKILGQNISPTTNKSHFDLTFKGYMRHYKGDRKDKWK